MKIQRGARVIIWSIFLFAWSVGLARAQPSVTVPLILAGSDHPQGNAILTAHDEGTHITLTMNGLGPHETAGVVLNAGTCGAPGASGAHLLRIAADEHGNATATGQVLFHGSDPIPLRDIADDAHIISIVGEAGMIACGTIPNLATTSDDAPAEPTSHSATGSPAIGPILLLVAILAAMLVVARRYLQRRAST